MFGHTFKGGIHPYDGKELSKDKAISSIFPKGDLVYPLSQHIGAPAVPIVEKGEHVLVGQKIAEAGGFVSAPIHASVSGTVKGVEKHLTVTGNLADCIVIENDGKYEEIVWPERKPLEQMTPKEILEMPKYGCVNVHASLLPKYRGAAPIQWAVINGEKVSGVTTMRMDEGLDTGDMILKEEVVLDEKETGGSLFDRLSGVGAKLCVRTLEAIEDGTAIYTKQDHAAATKTTLIKTQFGIIDWNKPAAEIECLIRGLNPWPSAYTYLNGKTLKIWAAAVKDETSDKEPGELTEVTKHSVGVQTGDGILMLEEVQLEGKKRMSADAFLRGNALSEGMKLGE